MTLPWPDWPWLVIRMFDGAALLALAMAVAVAIERTVFAYLVRRTRYVEDRYRSVVSRVVAGDATVRPVLALVPARYRLDLASMLVVPLIDDRDPIRIARTRAAVDAMALGANADRHVRSWWSGRRAIAVRVFGLLQMTERTAKIIAALDDPHPDVRAAALDALRDLQSREALRAIVIRLNDASLHAGRRAAALAAFGDDGEPLILDLARVDTAQRAHYARALMFCGTARSRATLCDWTFDRRPEVRAAALHSLARVGLDDRCARRALECLEHADPQVRAMAAHALRGWSGSSFTASQLARHLDDVWTVAVRSAHSLRSMRPYGLDALRLRAQRDGVAGILARQMLWEEQVHV
jgi:hypothetical protein